MNLDRMDVCSLMFFLGWIQVIWAAIQIGVTKSATVRKHFGYYFLGVLSYFILLILLAMLIAIEPKSHILFEIHFFGSAFGLAIYHVFIVGMSIWIGSLDPKEVTPDEKTVAE
jgi:hypothetical protein